MDVPSPSTQDQALSQDPASASASQDPPTPPSPLDTPPQESHPPLPTSSTQVQQDPLTFPPNPRPPFDAFLFTRPWVLSLLPPILLWYPLTALPLAAAVGVYHYLLHEERFNASLVRATPPAPDEGLPKGRRGWLEGGGLLQVGKEEGEGREEGGECVVCRGEWEDPVRVRECGHVFCGSCLGAWFKGGHRTCPQCTRPLWREDPSSIGHLRELERLAKATAAISFIAFPTTLLANAAFILYIFTLPPPQRSISRWIMLFALLGTSALVLTLMFSGFQFMFARRRTHGTGWWGAELADAEESNAWRMALCTLSLVAGVWLVQVCVVGEEFGRGLAPGWMEWRVWVRMGWGGAWGL